MAENQKQKSRKENVSERLASRYPDRDFTDEEVMFGQIDDDYADYEKRLGEYADRENVLEEGLAKNPQASQFFVGIMKGENPWTSLVKTIGVEGVTDLMNDPEKQEELAEANKSYVERLAKEKSLEEEYTKNIEESMNTLEQMKNEQGLSDETLDAAMDQVLAIVNDAVVGKFSRETLDMVLKSMSRDADLKNARQEGEIAGRNAKIEETLKKPKAGDGMPAMGGATAAVPTEKKKGFFDDLPRRKF